MRSALKVLLVGAVSAALLMLGITSAGASVAAPAVATVAPAGPAMFVMAKHSGLQCRHHSAESKAVKGKVVVPASYCYDPATTKNPGWHDYCTHSPDSYGSADFRGPCARHDMCLQAGHSHHTCDGPLLANMKTNCKHSYGRWNPTRYKCEATAYGYYGFIKAYTFATSHA